MPDTTKPGLKFLDEAIAIAGQFNALIPVTVFAAKQLYALLKRDNPTLTPEQFYEYCRTQGREVKAISSTWLTAHGYTLGADGKWKPPAPDNSLPMPEGLPRPDNTLPPTGTPK